MARHLHLMHHATSTTQIGLGITSVFLCVIALIMCASHSRRWRPWRCGSRSFEPIIQVHNEAMVLTTDREHQLGAETGEKSGAIEGLQGGPVWQKGILMGKKCQLPDYSGIITYDSEGKLTKQIGNSRLRQEMASWGN